MKNQNNWSSCSYWLKKLANTLRTQGHFPQPSELGITVKKIANCLEQASLILNQNHTLPYSTISLEHSFKKDKDIYSLYTDGGSQGNPGPAGIGAVLLTPSGQIESTLKRYLGITTNNVAEYQGVLVGLELALARGIKRLKLYLDSELLVRQLKGQYKVKAAHLVPLFQQANSLLSCFEQICLTHILREQNFLADQLVKQAISEKIKLNNHNI